MATKKNRNALVENPTTKFSTLTIDGKDYKLCWDFRSIKDAEVRAGVNLFECIDLQQMTARQYSGMLFAATRKAHPSMTPEDVDALIRIHTLRPINDAIAEAWVLSMPKQKEGEENPTPEPMAE